MPLLVTPISNVDAYQLREWLIRDDRLRGNIHMQSAKTPAEAMGNYIDVLIAAIGAGGLVQVVVGGINTWLSTQRSDAVIEIAVGDKWSLKLTATNLKSSTEIVELSAKISEQLSENDAT